MAVLVDNMDAALSFTEKAIQCRRLATAVNDDRAVKVLLALAEKYEAQAVECATGEDRRQTNACSAPTWCCVQRLMSDEAANTNGNIKACGRRR
jgi:hypothetical protein